MNVNNIDVTLRDGGYRNNFSFSMTYILQHVEAMHNSQLDYIELGYRNGSLKYNPSYGITAQLNNQQVQQIARSFTYQPSFCIMLHPKNITSEDIKNLADLGISMVRFVMDDSRRSEMEAQVSQAKAVGLRVASNLTRVTHFTSEQIIEKAVFSKNIGADIIYVADSNGHMIPEDVIYIVSELKRKTKISIGFHSHDHLGLALANSIAALNAGADFIDSSLHGMGKGAGNLKLESWVGFLKRKYGEEKYDFSLILQQIASLHRTEEYREPHHGFKDFVMGLFDLSIDDCSSIGKNINGISDFFEHANFLYSKNIR